MGFSLSYDTGFVGSLVIVFLISAVMIAAIWLVKAAKEARDEVVEHQEPDDQLKW